MIRTGVAIKSWIAQTPSVDDARPARCADCGAASWPNGGCLVVHGQGLLQRQARGVLQVDGEPGVVAIAVRRYECQKLRRRDDGRAGGNALGPAELGVVERAGLHLWLVLGLSDRLVRGRVCAWQVRGRSGRGWAQLYRWARGAASVFGLPRTAGIARCRIKVRWRAEVE